MRRLLCLVALLAFTLPLRAQQAESEPLVVSFVAIPPFAYFDTDGNRTGFLIELARAIGEEIGVPIELLDVQGTQQFVQTQISGETQMIAGVARLPAFADTNLFSDMVAQDKLRLGVLETRVEDFGTGPGSGMRLGIVPPAVGSEEKALLADNIAVEFESPEAAVMGLLIGNIDALLLPEPVVFAIARNADIDGRIRFIGEPLREVTRVVALHQSRAELLGPVNAAIARLEADGRLEELRQRFSISVPPPPADVLTVGVSHFPPYQIVNEDGSFGGIGVKILRELAERAHVTLEMKEITSEEWGQGPGTNTYDILPQASITPDRARRMDFTLPVLANASLSVFTRAGEATGLSDLNDLIGLRVGVVNVNVGRSVAEAHGGLDLHYAPAAPELFDMLRNSEVDAVLYTPEVARSLIEANDMAGEITEILPPLVLTQRAIAMRFGMASVRDKFNAIIPGYLVSPEFAALRQSYFGEPDYWTPERRRMAYAVASLLALAVLFAFLLQNIVARRRAEVLATETQNVSSRLNAVMDAAQSGVVGLSRTGDIALLNIQARHMLGGLTEDTPIDWPRNIRFLDSETMQPMEASADPVNRALAGQVIKGQTAIMSRQSGDDPRYVRVSSSSISSQTSPDVGTVLVLDDVSEQERNRQQVERSSRLDALGQLTGGIAHDFNNLLATIEYGIQLAGTEEDVQQRDRYHNTALSSVRRGSELTRRLLAFAKRQPGLERSVPAREVLEEFAKLAAPTIEETIELTFHETEPNLWVHCDIAQLENALLNLVLNARDAILRSGKGNKIALLARGVAELDADVEQRREDTQTYIAEGMTPAHGPGTDHSYRFVEFSVTDNGPGMTEETKRRAIDPFFTTKDTNSGTGLGLPMVYGFIQQSDGELLIYSEVGHGTTVRLLLPRGTPEGERESPVERPPRPRGTGQLVLIVEDEPELGEMMADLVTSFGYSVLRAANGAQALELLQSREPVELLLTDIVMPGGIGGFELAARARELRSELPVVYMSGYTGFSEQEMGAVVAPMIQKPAPPAELARILEQVFKNAAANSD